MSTKAIDIEALGFSAEELQERVIERCCDRLLHGTGWDDDGEPTAVDTRFKQKLHARIKERIDQAIDAIAAEHVLPNVSEYIENLTLQETNRWGEKQGKPVTFVEYLVQRAEAYLNEKVDAEGHSKEETRHSYWSGKQTRVTHLVHLHLHYSIETAMKKAIEQANVAIVGGLEQTVKLKLAELSQSLKVKMEVGR